MDMSSKEIERIRKRDECSLMEARKSYIQDSLLKATEDATSIDDLKNVILDILKHML